MLKSYSVQILHYREAFHYSHLNEAEGHAVTTALQEIDFLTL